MPSGALGATATYASLRSGAMHLSAIQKADVIVRILGHLGLSDQPRAPDPHDCEDRDPAAVARHPLLHPDGENAGTDGPVADPNSDWPMDSPHAEE